MKKKMKKYKIEISRTVFAFETFEVEAESEDKAVDEAMQMAYDTCFSDGNVEYDISSIETEGE